MFVVASATSSSQVPSCSPAYDPPRASQSTIRLNDSSYVFLSFHGTTLTLSSTFDRRWLYNDNFNVYNARVQPSSSDGILYTGEYDDVGPASYTYIRTYRSNRQTSGIPLKLFVQHLGVHKGLVVATGRDSTGALSVHVGDSSLKNNNTWKITSFDGKGLPHERNYSVIFHDGSIALKSDGMPTDSAYVSSDSGATWVLTYAPLLKPSMWITYDQSPYTISGGFVLRLTSPQTADTIIRVDPPVADVGFYPALTVHDGLYIVRRDVMFEVPRQAVRSYVYDGRTQRQLVFDLNADESADIIRHPSFGYLAHSSARFIHFSNNGTRVDTLDAFRRTTFTNKSTSWQFGFVFADDATDGQGLVRSRDHGRNWEEVGPSNLSRITDVRSVGRIVVALDANGYCAMSTDQGWTWRINELPSRPLALASRRGGTYRSQSYLSVVTQDTTYLVDSLGVLQPYRTYPRMTPLRVEFDAKGDLIVLTDENKVLRITPNEIITLPPVSGVTYPGSIGVSDSNQIVIATSNGPAMYDEDQQSWQIVRLGIGTRHVMFASPRIVNNRLYAYDMNGADSWLFDIESLKWLSMNEPKELGSFADKHPSPFDIPVRSSMICYGIHEDQPRFDVDFTWESVLNYADIDQLRRIDDFPYRDFEFVSHVIHPQNQNVNVFVGHNGDVVTFNASAKMVDHVSMYGQLLDVDDQLSAIYAQNDNFLFRRLGLDTLDTPIFDITRIRILFFTAVPDSKSIFYAGLQLDTTMAVTIIRYDSVATTLGRLILDSTTSLPLLPPTAILREDGSDALVITCSPAHWVWSTSSMRLEDTTMICIENDGRSTVVPVLGSPRTAVQVGSNLVTTSLLAEKTHCDIFSTIRPFDRRSSLTIPTGSPSTLHRINEIPGNPCALLATLDTTTRRLQFAVVSVASSSVVDTVSIPFDGPTYNARERFLYRGLRPVSAYDYVFLGYPYTQNILRWKPKGVQLVTSVDTEFDPIESTFWSDDGTTLRVDDPSMFIDVYDILGQHVLRGQGYIPLDGIRILNCVRQPQPTELTVDSTPLCRCVAIDAP
ncbi:MAG TPA: hypothetical protein DIS79_10455 [Bacteroidetes bacterium]|nr:hypothetical protein [Bacteroidota bacterium]